MNARPAVAQYRRTARGVRQNLGYTFLLPALILVILFLKPMYTTS